MNATIDRVSRGWRASALLLGVVFSALIGGPAAHAADSEPSTAASPQPHPLSVAPLDHATYPEHRPEWVDADPQLEGDVAVWPVKSLLCSSAEQAAESLRVQMRGAVAAYAEHVLGEDRARRLGADPVLRISLEEIPSHDTYTGTATLGDQQVYEQAVRLRFTESFRRELAAAWQQHEVTHRLSKMAVASSTGLCLLLAGTGLVRRFARPTA